MKSVNSYSKDCSKDSCQQKIKMNNSTAVELGNVVSKPQSADLEQQSNEKLQEIKNNFVGQMKVPVYQKVHFWSPDFVKCDGKIIKYDLRAFGVWRVSL